MMGWGVQGMSHVNLMKAHLVLVKNVEGSAKFEWRVRELLWFFSDLQNHCK